MKLAVATLVLTAAASAFGAPQDLGLSPPAPDDSPAVRAMLLPDFLKDVDKFSQISRTLAAYRNRGTPDRASDNQINKNAKALEDRVDHMLDYLLDGGSPRNPQQFPRTNDSSLADRLAVLDATASSVVRKVRQYLAGQRRDEVDARLVSDLIEDLQAIKLIARDLRRAAPPASHAALVRPTLKNVATGMEFVRITPGEFTMGCSGRQNQCDPDESPPRRIRITKEFEVGI
jgi:hypothetical protein